MHFGEAREESDSRLCWICHDPADSGEHIFKASDLRRIFDRDGYAAKDRPFHFSFESEGFARIAGPKSSTMKYQNVLCKTCNNDRTSAFDRAYSRLSEWFAAKQSDYEIDTMDLREVFGAEYVRGVDETRRYFAKAMGCRIVDAGLEPPESFPNPVTRKNLELLRISICRAEPLSSLPNYKPSMGERILGKGDMYGHVSRAHLEKTGEQNLTGAIWWETVGHFQINYWFNIDPHPDLGFEFSSEAPVYRIVRSELNLQQMKDALWAWSSKQCR